MVGKEVVWNSKAREGVFCRLKLVLNGYAGMVVVTGFFNSQSLNNAVTGIEVEV